jgi:hypothetical protein
LKASCTSTASEFMPRRMSVWPAQSTPARSTEWGSGHL